MKITLKKVISSFLTWAERTLAKNTVLAYRYHLGLFLAATKNKQVRNLRPLHLTEWGKCWHDFQAVMRCFNWAVEQAKMVRKNPFEGIPMPCRNERKRILSPVQITRFLRSTSPTGRAFLIAMRESFARPQEIRAACWDDLCSEDPTIPIEVALPSGKALIVLREYKDRRRRKDSNRPRVLLVNARLGRQLMRLMACRDEAESHIWLNARGSPWTSSAIRCMMRRVRRRMGLGKDKHGENIVAYTMRHSQATLAASKGIVDRVLADIMGHVETRTTARYQHLNVQHLRQAVERLRCNRSTTRKNIIPPL